MPTGVVSRVSSPRSFYILIPRVYLLLSVVLRCTPPFVWNVLRALLYVYIRSKRVQMADVRRGGGHRGTLPVRATRLLKILLLVSGKGGDTWLLPLSSRRKRNNFDGTAGEIKLCKCMCVFVCVSVQRSVRIPRLRRFNKLGNLRPPLSPRIAEPGIVYGALSK